MLASGGSGGSGSSGSLLAESGTRPGVAKGADKASVHAQRSAETGKPATAAGTAVKSHDKGRPPATSAPATSALSKTSKAAAAAAVSRARAAMAGGSGGSGGGGHRQSR